MLLRPVRTEQELLDLVEEVGFLPFFKNDIPGFSIEECCPEELWFMDDVDGPWEWKGPVIRSKKCIYGKLFRKKAGFVSKVWIPDLANFRRDGYDFDALYDDGLAPFKDKGIYDLIEQHGTILSKDLRALGNYKKGQNKGFETIITRLQMQTYICPGDFPYMVDKFGNPYGWGVAEFTTPEALFGYDFVTSAYKIQPQESREKIISHLAKLLPHATDKQLLNLIK